MKYIYASWFSKKIPGILFNIYFATDWANLAITGTELIRIFNCTIVPTFSSLTLTDFHSFPRFGIITSRSPLKG